MCHQPGRCIVLLLIFFRPSDDPNNGSSRAGYGYRFNTVYLHTHLLFMKFLRPFHESVFNLGKVSHHVIIAELINLINVCIQTGSEICGSSPTMTFYTT